MDKLEEIRNYFTEAEAISPDMEMKLFLPGEEGADQNIQVPYILMRYYFDEDRYQERKLELFEYYLQDDVKELINKVIAMAEEFAMEVENTEFGGG